jgi:hypothetical protein
MVLKLRPKLKDFFGVVLISVLCSIMRVVSFLLLPEKPRDGRLTKSLFS